MPHRILRTAAVVAACCCGGSTFGCNVVVSTIFTVSGGIIHAPGGAQYIARGINVADWAAVGPGGASNGTNNGAAMLSLFPGINLVRLNMQKTYGDPIVSGGLTSTNGVQSGTTTTTTADSSGYNCDPANFTQFVQNVTGYNTAGAVVGSTHAVVVIEDHEAGNPTIAPGTSQITWYTNCATYYKNNPYVWFGTTNEPAINTTNQQDQNAIYNAVRGASNPNPVLLALISSQYPGNQSAWISGSSAQTYYTGLTNVVWEVHGYAWQYGGQSSLISQATVNAFYATQVADLNAGVTSVDGVIPVIWGEYGTSTSGATVDTSGTRNVIGVQNNPGSGSAAWTWQAGASDKLQSSNVLTNFGTEVAGYIATGVVPGSWTDSDGS